MTKFNPTRLGIQEYRERRRFTSTGKRFKKSQRWLRFKYYRGRPGKAQNSASPHFSDWLARLGLLGVAGEPRTLSLWSSGDYSYFTRCLAGRAIRLASDMAMTALFIHF